ncbi:MAG: transcription elongation factor GreA [Candidatus Woesebacteria bacterium]|nr:transcription elongation factor GreA [Candidatus Woesebacteria bacterium]
MAKVIQMTKVGIEALSKELTELIKIKRPRLVERLAFARGEGDLSENSDYQSAREELEFMDGRISEIEEVLKNALIVSVNGKNDNVGVGTKITVKFNGEKHVFEMVGEWEADPINRKISPESPLGKALLGRKVGDKTEVEAPAGKVTYEILAIE